LWYKIKCDDITGHECILVRGWNAITFGKRSFAFCIVKSNVMTLQDMHALLGDGTAITVLGKWSFAFCIASVKYAKFQLRKRPPSGWNEYFSDRAKRAQVRMLPKMVHNQVHSNPSEALEEKLSISGQLYRENCFLGMITLLQGQGS
jgi:hypothetical protein